MRRLALGFVFCGALFAVACSDSIGPGTQPQFSQEITVDELEDILGAGATRVEIEAPPGTPPLIANEVEVKGADELTDEEKIESPIEDLELAATGCGGTLTLALGGIEVQFNATTEFEAENGDELTCAEFVAAVEAALAAGDQPAIEAERAPLATPQAPGNGTFVAAEVKLDDEADDPEIEINVGLANLFDCNALSGAPAGCLRVVKVLNVPFVVQEGMTEIEAERPELVGEVDFEGVVKSVDLAGSSCSVGTVTLTNGTIIQVVVGTEIKGNSGDDDQLDDLCEVEDALGNELIAEADGKGVVTDDDPLTIVAIEVEFEVERNPEDVVGKVDFEGVVASVSPEGTSCTLGNVTLESGKVIQLVEGTDIDNQSGDSDQLDNLCQVQAALADKTVEADGEGVVTAVNPLTIVASQVKFEIQD